MGANQEIIAELRRVLNERDEAREQLYLTKAELGRWVDRETKAVRERDEAREEVARLNALLSSVTAENQYRAQREACALQDWQALRAECDEARARCKTLRVLADEAAYEQGLAQRRMMDAQCERDEARAEVERLRMMLPVHPSSLTDACTDAYRRGAEAMREHIAEVAGRNAALEWVVELVRALPIPEEP